MTQTTSQATYNDAELILKLYDMRREERMRAARAWFIANFAANSLSEALEKYPLGSDHNAYYRMVGTYWDMAASSFAAFFTRNCFSRTAAKCCLFGSG